MTAMRIITGEESDEISIPESAGYPWDSQSFLYARSVYLHIKALYDVCDAREMRQWDSSLDELFSNELGKLALEGLRENLAALFENYGDKEINLADISAQLTRMKGLPPLNPVRERLLDTISTKLSSVPPEQVIWVLEAYKQYIADYLKLKEERDIPINSALNSVRLLVNLGAYINQMFEGDLVDHVVRDEDGRQVVTRCTAWEKFSEEAHLDEVNPSLEAILAGYNGFRKYVASDARSPDLEEVIQAFDLMFKDTNNHDLRWSGALGTGLYSQSTLNLYDRINRFFIDRDANIFLVASSRDNVPQSAGVKPQHCYSIIGVSEKMVNGHLLKFIRIRNPWGHTGIRYDWNAEHELRDGNKSVASEVRDGYAEFDVELSDFAKFFGRYSVGRFDSPRLRNVAIADMRGEQELYSPIRADARNQPAPARDWSDVAKIAGFVAGAVIGGLAAAAFAFILLPMLMTTWVVASIAIVVAGASVGALLGLEIGERAERAIRSRRAARAYEYQRIPSDIEQQSSMPASRASHRQDSPASDFRVPASQSSGKAKLFSPLASAAEAEVRGRENDDRLERESEVARPNKRK
jgi:hypothetical protein